MLKKNDIIELQITGITSEGSGIGRYNNMAVFVSGTAKGDVISAVIINVKKNYAIGKMLSIIKSSEDRIEVDCNSFPSCGGCVFRHISYDSELKIKEELVKDCLKRIGGFDNISINPIIYGKVNCYRNKSQKPIGKDKYGNTYVGFYSFHSHRIVKCDNCFLHDEIFSKIEFLFLKWANSFNISVYDENSRTGILRHLYIRFAQSTKEIMVCIVINGKALPFQDELKDTLTESIDNIKSIVININKEDTNVILGNKSYLLYGRDYIIDELLGLKFKLSVQSFYQVNRSQAEKLYSKAIEYANLTGNETVLDLYCGTGTIGLCCAKHAKQVIGAEIVSQAIKDAEENAKLNGIYNSRFICADASIAADKLKSEKTKPDVIIIDPPRKGCSPDLIHTIVDMAPFRVVYVSCDPATLARDLKMFCDYGYSINEVTPVDMFPRTGHVETVVLMTRTGTGNG